MNRSTMTRRVLASLVLLTTAVASACGGRAINLSAEAPLGTSARPGDEIREAEELRDETRSGQGREHSRALLGGLPVHFIENHGQLDPRVAYYVRGRDTDVYFTPTGVTLVLAEDARARRGRAPETSAQFEEPSRRLPIQGAVFAPEDAPRGRWAVRLDFVGANAVTPRGLDRTPAVVSYWTGGEEASPVGLPTYRGVVYPDLWPGIDLVYTGASGQLKYTFLVKPGADPRRIRLAYAGASAVALTDEGRLDIATPVGSFSDDRPYAYQDGARGREEVPARFAPAAGSADARVYGFALGAYDTSRTLVLDPSVIVYAGYIGGGDFDGVNGIAVDAAGNAYVVGTTRSAVPSFPGKVGPDLVLGGKSDAFVAKIKADGTDVVYLGYIGGAGPEEGLGIAVDKAGNAYVTGSTESDEATFPVKIGPRLVYGGSGDAFVAKVKADGTGLVYCGYIGGAGTDDGKAIAVDAAGNAYVAGGTISDEASFPVTAGPGLVFHVAPGLPEDAFVARVKADGSGFAYAGYIGGTGSDIANAIAVDSAGNAYVAGNTTSDQSSFPVKVGPELTFTPGVFASSGDAFVAKVKADGSALVYAGYIGGNLDDEALGIAVDAAGNAYVTGVTNSDESTFPVRVGPDLHYHGGDDAFVAKVRADGTGLVYAGYIGGNALDVGRAIAVDAAGNAYVAGDTQSDQSTFPVKLGPQLTLQGGSDAFVARIAAGGRSFGYVGYLGGAGFEVGAGIAVDPAGNVYVGGTTTSSQSSFPVAVGPDLTFAGGFDGFVAKLSGKPNLQQTASVLAVPIFAKPGGTVTVFDTVRNPGLGAAKASFTRYYLSTDAVKGAGDVLLGGGRAVAALEPGDLSSGSATVSLPANVPLGAYLVLACADDGKVIAELDETDNCLAGNLIQVTLPDLAVTGTSVPPSAVQRGHAFSMSDTVQNFGSVAAGASTTRYYLSRDTAKGAGDILLAGSRAVGALGASATSNGAIAVTVPASAATGAYRLLACADDVNAVKEVNEGNNCAVAGQISVTP